jgi:hypothetical protein
MMKLKHPLGDSEIKRLVYAKFLVLQGKKYLENNVNEYYFNISIIFFANAVEIAVQVCSLCVDGKDRYDKPISGILKELKEIERFPYGEFEKITRTRNAIYHNAILNTHQTCKDVEELTERSLSYLTLAFLGIKYEDLSLIELIKDENVKSLLKEAEKKLSKNELEETVINSLHAFAVFKGRLDQRSYYQITDRELQHSKISWSDAIRSRFRSHNVGFGSNSSGYITNSDLDALSRHIEEQVNKKIVNLARHSDFSLLLGENYEDYKYFVSICPLYHITLNGFSCEKDSVEQRKYGREQVEFIFNFVLRIVLDIERKLKPVELRLLNGEIYSRIE